MIKCKVYGLHGGYMELFIVMPTPTHGRGNQHSPQSIAMYSCRVSEYKAAVIVQSHIMFLQ